MKQLPVDLQAQLDNGVSTLCWCWHLTRRDGVEMGFTDHDRDISFDGIVFEAAAGFTASDIKDSVGLNVDNLNATGALSSDRLDESELASGLFDDAKVEIYRVDWTAPDNRVLMRSGSLGEVKRSTTAFEAEIRGLAHYLQQPSGRLFQYGCDADVGDARCKVNLNQAAFKGTGTVNSVASSRKFTATGLNSFSSGWFNRGLATFQGGDADGAAIEVKSHHSLSGTVTITLWQPLRLPLEVGQVFEVTAGCNKTIGTCQQKFNNRTNYRGFPQMPGNDFVTKFASSSRN